MALKTQKKNEALWGIKSVQIAITEKLMHANINSG